MSNESQTMLPEHGNKKKKLCPSIFQIRCRRTINRTTINEQLMTTASLVSPLGNRSDSVFLSSRRSLTAVG